MNNGLKKQKQENQKSKQFQKKSNYDLIKSICVLMVIAACVFAVAITISNYKPELNQNKTRIGVTTGVPYIIGKVIEGKYGQDIVQFDGTQVYDFQDC